MFKVNFYFKRYFKPDSVFTRNIAPHFHILETHQPSYISSFVFLHSLPTQHSTFIVQNN